MGTFITTNHKDILDEIKTKKELSPELDKRLNKICLDFTTTYLGN